jgi:hypothetical protein
VNLPEPYAWPTPASVIRVTRRSDDADRWRGDSKSHPRSLPEAWFSANTRETFDEGDFYLAAPTALLPRK